MPGFRKTRRRLSGGAWIKMPTGTKRRTPKKTRKPRTPTPPGNKPRRSTFTQRMNRRTMRTGRSSRRRKRKGRRSRR